MCVIIAKHFDKYGWVICKNRDQDYISNVSFLDIKNKNVGELLLLYDHDTGYKEGMNHNKMAIATTSLTPDLEDETDKEDGNKIEKALGMKSPEEAAKFLVSKQLTGFIFIATPDKLILIEAARTENGKGEYHSKVRIVPKTEIVCRTNHGIEFSWAGFQNGVDKQQDVWRKSSEERLKIAEKISKPAHTPEEMLECMAKWDDKDTQMNIFRVETKPKQMRTIFQWALVTGEDHAIVRPIQCRFKVNVDRENLFLRFLDNASIKKTYGDRLKHFCKMKETKDGKEIHSEGLNTFKSFMLMY